jgi:S1-C subfamily serine protease
LIVGDILVGVGGTPVNDHDELFAQLAGDIVGKPVAVEILRGGAVTTVNVVIGER